MTEMLWVNLFAVDITVTGVKIKTHNLMTALQYRVACWQTAWPTLFQGKVAK